MGKANLIKMIRQAQREKDPRKRDQLWDELWEYGLPSDATVLPVVTNEVKDSKFKKSTPEKFLGE